ncbi:GNAT family N-acetyltransferase [Tritonibacter horizontis]|uniref:N-acetyltransferase domain-containing protein n=1 Tax=Tritonibacter horizontis TaxID=1768241 RepID=A0A132C1S4_9RHOB|nr:GNAT family N-acetyltransferase [Tritonibacter horizontis]KUP94446.1 hypothetical protein TRIHO_06710 [Tritonibacter horizontis]
MPAFPAADIRFLRLPEIPLAEIARHMSDPRLAAHMPLLAGVIWDAETTARFVATKEACWHRDGLGHWAFVQGDRYVGWGGFQKEDEAWDFGLVLRPEAFGLGLTLARQALAIARTDPRIPFVTFLLPPSRRHLGALRRLGAKRLADVTYQGTPFQKYRLETA